MYLGLSFSHQFSEGCPSLLYLECPLMSHFLMSCDLFILSLSVSMTGLSATQGQGP